MSTAFLTAEIAELRQMMRDLLAIGRDVVGSHGQPAVETMVQLARACDRADRLLGRKP
jgi:hypothetical protein